MAVRIQVQRGLERMGSLANRYRYPRKRVNRRTWVRMVIMEARGAYARFLLVTAPYKGNGISVEPQ